MPSLSRWQRQMSLTINHVRRYHELGFVVHPCCPADHRCQSPGKIPYDPIEGHHMRGWQKHGLFNEELWQEWLDQDSSINIGFLTGLSSRIVAIDIDSDAGLGVLDDTIDNWRETWRFKTGRGFRCLYQYAEAAVSTIVSRGDSSYEILGDGRQSVLPPSEHPNGKRYSWVDGHTPRDSECLSAETWIRTLTPTTNITSDREDWESTIQRDTERGGRNTTLTRLAGHLMNPCPMPAEEAYVWLSLYNQKHCKPPLGDREIRAILSSIKRREEAQQADRDREIRDFMKRYQLSYSEAEEMWRGM